MILTKFIKNKKNQIFLLKGGLLTIILISTIPITILISRESNEKKTLDNIEQNKFLSSMKSRYGNKYFLDSENSLEDWGLTSSQIFKEEGISDIKIKYVEYDFENKNVKAKIFWKKNNIQKSKAIIVEGFKDPKIKLYNNKKISENEFKNIVLPQNFTIPQSVKKIHQTAFFGSVLPEKLKIPTSVKIIEDEAFKNVKGKIPLIPDSVTKLGKSIFKGSILPDNWIHPKAWSQTIPDYSYAWATLHNDFKVPESVIQIENYAFHNAKLNNNFKIPDHFKKTDKNHFIKKENLNHKNKITKDLNLIKANESLVKGATLSGTEEKDFNNTLKSATQAIDKISTINEINNAKKEWLKIINAKKELLNKAIIQANENKEKSDLLKFQEKVKDDIRKIRISKSLEGGVNKAPVKKAELEEAINEASLEISKAKTVEAVNKAKAKWNSIVSSKKNALEKIVRNKITIDGFLKSNAKINGMKIWKTSDYYGVVVPLGTSIQRNQIENIFYINKDFKISFDAKFKNGNQEGIFKVTVDTGNESKFIFKIFVTGETFNFNNYFNKKELAPNFALPNNVKTIKKLGFNETIFNKGFKIPSSVETIEDEAFAYAKNIPLVPNSVTKIGERVFSNVTLPHNWKNPQAWNEIIPSWAYEGTVFPTNFKFNKNTIKTIEGGSFKKAKNVPLIPDSVQKIERSAFIGATFTLNWESPKVWSITIPKFAYQGAILPKRFELQDTVRTIEDGAFAYAKNIPLIPDSVTKIGLGVFSNTKLPNNWIHPKAWRKTVSHSSYAGTTLPEGFKIPSSVEAIEYWAFRNAKNVPLIPDSVSKIAYFAFTNAVFSKNWIHPKAWSTIIPNYSYFGTTLPEGFKIPKSVKAIGHFAFKNAKNVPSIPDSVTKIATTAFAGATLSNSWKYPKA